MYRNMRQWTEIRRRVLVEGVSQRQILRKTGMHGSTLKKILTNTAPSSYHQTQPRSQPKIGPYREWLQQTLTADRALSRNQRHTARRLSEWSQEEGYDGGYGYTAVKETVREPQAQGQEVFIPLVHRPGEVQVDFGEAVVRLGGQLRVVKFFLMALPYADALAGTARRFRIGRALAAKRDECGRAWRAAISLLAMGLACHQQLALTQDGSQHFVGVKVFLGDVTGRLAVPGVILLDRLDH
jgi:hypothetical protein